MCYAFKKNLNVFLAVCSADLGSELIINSLPVRQKSSWIFLSTSFSLPLPCFNPQDLACSSLHCKLKSESMKVRVLSDLSLDKSSFLVIAYMKQQTFCSLRSWSLRSCVCVCVCVCVCLRTSAALSVCLSFSMCTIIMLTCLSAVICLVFLIIFVVIFLYLFTM